MTTTPSTREQQVRSRTISRSLPWYTFGAANLIVVTVLSLVFWYLLVDPKWSGLNIYPEPFFALLFWAILAVVWIGFNLEFHGFSNLRQPMRGLLLILLVVGISLAITFTIAYGWGYFDSSFAASRAEGTGYFTGALFVLFGFFTYVMSVINWGHWPWSKLTVQQPWLGIGEISLITIPTLLIYAVLGLPGLASWADPAKAWFSTNTLIGWFYSLIVVALLTGLLFENWPWRLAGSPGRVALASAVGNVILGTGLYYLLLASVKGLVGSADVTGIGSAITSYPAELGVCWAFWMIFWSNAFGNYPNGPSSARNYVVRAAITLVLGIGTFLVYYYLIAGPVLHEPVVTGSMHGNALGWMDWMVLWALFYILCLNSYGLPKPRELQNAGGDVPPGDRTPEPAD